MKIIFAMTACVFVLSNFAWADKKQDQILITNVNVFDGVHEELMMDANVFIDRNIIKTVASGPIPVNNSARVKIIDGKGSTLTPGFVDAHTHIALIAPFDQLDQLENEYTGVYVGAAGGQIRL